MISRRTDYENPREMPSRPLRVIQWATGNVGIEALIGIAESPRLELAGLRVYSPEKAGREAGDLFGGEPLGIVATTDIDEILAIDADCVCYTPLRYDVDEICALLRSGKNVVTTAGLIYPQALAGSVFERIEEACREGGVSFHGTGLNPGWIAELLPLVSTSMCRKVRRVHSLEVCDVSDYGSEKMFRDFMKYGRTPEDFEADAQSVAHLGDVFRESIAMIATAMDVEIDEIRHDREFVLADRDFECAVGTIRKGTIAAQRHQFSGLKAGAVLIQVETRWKVVREDLGAGMPADGECTWTITVEGQPSIRNVVSLAETFDPQHPDYECYSSRRGMISIAMHALNAVPVVCAAAPGVRTFLDLPLFGGRVGAFAH
jgi:hypothetical protein